MGWKISIIIVNDKFDKDVNKLTEILELGKSKIVETKKLNECLYSDNICVGFYGGKTMICHRAILMDFFDNTPSEIELKFSEAFKHTEMLVLGQYENVGITGFSYIKNGVRKRTKLYNEEDDEYVINYGNVLEIESDTDDYELPFQLPKIFIDKSLYELLDTEMYVLN